MVPVQAGKAKAVAPAPEKKVEVAAGKKRTSVVVAPPVQNKLASSIKK